MGPLHRVRMGAAACALAACLVPTGPGPARAASFDAGAKAYAEGDFPAAQAALLDVLKESPRNLEAMRLLGLAYLEEGRLREAFSTLQTAQVLAPHDARVQFALARVYYEAQLHDYEREALVAALRLDPENAQAHRFLAYNMLGGREHYAASAEYLWLLEQAETAGNPVDPVILFNLGALDARLGRPERAKRLLNRFLSAVAEGPQADEARAMLANLPPAGP